MGEATRREVVGELFVHDLRVHGMDVTATVDGGMGVHLRGSVDRADELVRL